MKREFPSSRSPRTPRTPESPHVPVRSPTTTVHEASSDIPPLSPTHEEADSGSPMRTPPTPRDEEEEDIEIVDAVPVGDVPEEKLRPLVMSREDLDHVVDRAIRNDPLRRMMRAALAADVPEALGRAPDEILDPIPGVTGSARTEGEGEQAEVPLFLSIDQFRALVTGIYDEVEDEDHYTFMLLVLLFVAFQSGVFWPFESGVQTPGDRVQEWVEEKWASGGGEGTFRDFVRDNLFEEDDEGDGGVDIIPGTPEVPGFVPSAVEGEEEVSRDSPPVEDERKAWDSPLADEGEEEVSPLLPNSDDDAFEGDENSSSSGEEALLPSGFSESTDEHKGERVFDEDSFSDDEPVVPASGMEEKLSGRRGKEPRPLGSGEKRGRDFSFDVPNGRNRQRLRIDDGGEWAQRAERRAAHFTTTLRAMLAKGDIDHSVYDGKPITAAQWNNIKDPLNTPYLRGIFERDRRSEYQSMHRKDARERRGEVLGGAEVKEPAAKRAKAVKAMRSRAMKGIPVRIRGRRVDLDAPIGNVVRDGPEGGSGPKKPLTARDVLGSLDAQRTFRSGKGLVDKPFHSLISNQKNIFPPNLTDDELEKVSQVTSLVCLWTLMYFSNPIHGDEVVPGISEVVFNIAFEDIMNLLRMNPGLIPESHRLFFEDPTFSLMTMRWSKKNVKKKYSEVTEPFAKLARDAPNSDFFKLCFLVVNAFTQILLADKLRKLLGGALVDNSSTPAFELFQTETLTNTNQLMNNLSLSPMRIESVKQEIPVTISENIANFIVRANTRVSLGPQ